ncbi:MAG: amidohydrolase family protein [Acidimicrobiia bacterium]
MELPRIISADDHVIEAPDVWTSRLPSKYVDRAPRVKREKGVMNRAAGGWNPDPDAPGAKWADVWYYETMVFPLIRGYAHSGYESDDALNLITYDDILPSTWKRAERFVDMDKNHTDVSLCYPSITRFCGQIFLEQEDKELSLLCVRAFNDWMIDEWCGTERPARLIPLTMIPLWDAELASEEIRRCADKGSHAVMFSECPPYLNLPSIYSGSWDPMFRACDETDTVINIHVGSSSNLISTAPDAPPDMGLCLTYVNSLLSLTDWLYSGVFELFPNLRVALAESQAGWIPFAAQRVDNTWKKGNEKWTESVAKATRRATVLPSSQLDGHIFACIFDDLEGLRNRDLIGMKHLLFETDFPHADSTFPHSLKTAEELVTMAGLNEQETYQFLRGNAIDLFKLDKYFGIDH